MGRLHRTATILSCLHALVAAAVLGTVTVLPAHAGVDSLLQWSSQQLSPVGQSVFGQSVTGDRTGRTHVFWPQQRPAGGTTTIEYAVETSSQWLTNSVLTVDAQSTLSATDSLGTLHLFWTNALDASLSHTTAFVDDALSPRAWSASAIVDKGPAYSPTLVIGPDDTLHVAFASCTPGVMCGRDRTITYISSSDGGRTWTRPHLFEVTREDAQPDRARLAMTNDGVLHLVWGLMPSRTSYGGLGIYYSRSRDNGSSWSSPMRLASVASNGQEYGAWQPSIAVRGKSELHVVWDAHTEAGQRYHQWSKDGGRTWSAPELVWRGFVAQTGSNPMVTDANDELYLVASGSINWLPGTAGVYVGAWNGQTWTPPHLVTTAINPHWPQAVITSGNLLHVLWEPRPDDVINTGVWHAEARLAAPYLPGAGYRRPAVQVAAPTSTVPPPSTPTPVIDKAAQRAAADLTNVPAAGPNQNWVYLLAGVAPAIFVGAAIVVAAVRVRTRDS